MSQLKSSAYLIISVLMLAVLISACSKGNSVIAPSGDEFPIFSELTSSENHSIIAIYDAVIDPDSQSFTIIPCERDLSAHFNLTQLYPNTVTVTGFGFTPTFWADIKISHPYPGSGVDVFDPRVIAVVPANAGVSFNYPAVGATGNHSAILEPDGYTKLFDAAGGSIAGNTNPFRAYYKSASYRRWSSTGTTSETQRWYMNLAGFGGPPTYKLIIDVSTNYPSAPQPVIDNAKEPVQITSWIGDGLVSSGGSASVEVTLLDWQGKTGIGGVVCECPNLFNGVVSLPYLKPGANANEFIYAGTITNSKSAPSGTYGMLIATWDQSTSVAMMKEVDVIVEGATITSVTEVTPPWLNFSPSDIYIDGNYAYIAGGYNGVHVFNIQNPLEPVWLKSVALPNEAYSIVVSNGYAYVAVYETGLVIIDVNPLSSASIIQTIPMTNPLQVSVWNGWAYVCEDNYLHIIDITPPETATLEVSFTNPSNIAGFEATNGYAYLAHYDGFSIIDVDPPESSTNLKTIPTPEVAYDVAISGNLAYVADRFGGIQVVDISVPANASIIKNVPTIETAWEITVANGYAYVFGEQLEILDIDPYDTAYSIKQMRVFGNVLGVAIKGDYAYVADKSTGLHVVKINPATSAEIKRTMGTSIASYIDVSGDYLYAACGHGGFQVYSVSRPESARCANVLRIEGGSPAKVIAHGGYAFVSIGYTLSAIDVDPVETMSEAGRYESLQSMIDMDYRDGIIYVIDGNQKLQVINAIDPYNISFVRELPVSGYPQGVAFSEDGNYAYVSNSYGPLDIYSAVPIDIPSLLTSYSSFANSEDVDAADGYAYIADNGYGLRVIDVEPYASANLVKTVDANWDYAHHVVVYNGYAFVSAQNNLHIVDVRTPESAYIAHSIPTDSIFVCSDVEGKYLYASNNHYGVRIYKLW